MAGSLKTALIANLLIAIVKAILGTISGSATMMAEAAHSLADTFNQILLVLGIRRSKKDPDLEHQFGYSKSTFFWAFVVAVLIFGVSGMFAFLEGLDIILHGDHELHPEYLIYNIIALFLAIILESYALRTAYREAKAHQRELNSDSFMGALDDLQDPVLNSLLVEDSLAPMGSLTAFIGLMVAYLTANPIYDGITSLVIGVLLITGGLLLAYENRTYLIGKAVAPRVQKEIYDYVSQLKEVEEIQKLRTMLMGIDDMILAIDVKFKDEYENTNIGELIDSIEEALEAKFEKVTKDKIFIEAQ